MSQDPAAAATVQRCLHVVNSAVLDETRAPAPHPCLAIASQSRIYYTICETALSCPDERILRAAVRFFSIVIDSEEEGFLDNGVFARSLIRLAKRTSGTNVVAIGEEGEGEIVELLFGIATKIRLQPEILPAWFTSRPQGKDGTNTRTQRNDFPLFYLLIDYVHHEGRSGDFARTGLLYTIEAAALSSELETWVIESDLATLMASGLGALYSQLSRYRLPLDFMIFIAF